MRDGLNARVERERHWHRRSSNPGSSAASWRDCNGGSLLGKVVGRRTSGGRRYAAGVQTTCRNGGICVFLCSSCRPPGVFRGRKMRIFQEKNEMKREIGSELPERYLLFDGLTLIAPDLLSRATGSDFREKPMKIAPGYDYGQIIRRMPDD
jgi:hypothetical protein